MKDLVVPACFVSLALAWLGETPASAKPIRLSRAFSPNPLVTEELRVRNGSHYLNDAGFPQCGNEIVTDGPVLTWTLTEPLEHLRVRLEKRDGDSGASGGVIVAPNGTYYCDDRKGEVYVQNWAAGSYKLYLYGPTVEVTAIVRFEMPTRSAEAVRKAAGKLPVVRLGDAPTNPTFVSLPWTAVAEAGDLGMGCAKPRQRLAPLATIEVTKASRYLLQHELELFAVVDDRCYSGADIPQLPVGKHTLWAVLPHGAKAPESIELQADDRERELVFGEAPRQTVGDLSEPLVLTGKVRPAQYWGGRDYTCSFTARAPDFYLTADRPVQRAEMSLLWGRKPQALHFFGPLGETTSSSRVSCAATASGRPPQKFDVLLGTYAVWVGGASEHAAAEGSEFHIFLRRPDVPVDPLASFAPIPGQLSRPEKAVTNHYPFASSGSMPVLFTQAPDRLFVFPVADIDQRTKLRTGEPLLVAWADARETTVYRYNGAMVAVDSRLLSDERPEQLWLPAKPEMPEVNSLAKARDLSGPDDAAAIAKYDALDSKYTACFGKYMAKNDPTWGKNHELYVLHSNGKVSNVSDRIAAKGSSKCGVNTLEKAGAALEKALARSRVERYSKRLREVRRRFGM